MKISEKARYFVSLVKRRNPYLSRRILRGIYENMLRILFKLYRYKKFYVLDEDWDYLILLDACRYDTFKEMNKIKGNLQKRRSAGSDTEEWLRNNFLNRKSDILYISSNPKTMRIKGLKESFWRLENAWDYGWDKKLDTVPPQEVSKAILRLTKKYPNKKIIAHYMQPHAPFIGKTKITFPRKENKVKQCLSVFEINDGVLFGGLKIELVKKAYKDNLKLVLDNVTNLVEKLDGKIVITADHGELFGEKKLYFHPRGIYIKELIEVPWLIIDKRKTKKPKELEGIKI